MNTRTILAAAAAVTLAACTGGEPTAVQTRAPALPRATGGQTVQTYTLFEWWRTPLHPFLPADSTAEFGIRFNSSEPGRVVGFRVYTYGPGTYELRLRNDRGEPVGMGGTLTTTDPTIGWKNVPRSTAPYTLTVGNYYRVSARTRNASLGVAPYAFPFTRNMLTATHGFIFMPSVQVFYDSDITAYFADVIFEPASELE